LHLDRSLSDTSTLSFGVSQRIARPQPENLNPYVNREYTPNLQAGNADLRPQYTNSFEVGYERETQGGSAGLTGYFRRNKDSMTSITRYLGNGVSLTTLANLPRNDAAGAEFTRRGHLGSRLSYSVSGNLFHTQIDASALGASGLQSTNGLNAKLKLDYQPVPGDTGQLTVTRTDRRLTPQGSISAVNLVNLGYRHKLRPDLTTVVTVSDLFNGQHYERMVSTPSFTGSYLRSVDGRVLYVGLIHAFGSTRNGEPVKFDYDE
jgi:outer membrane receptor for ferrienterochelin and colicin